MSILATSAIILPTILLFLALYLAVFKNDNIFYITKKRHEVFEKYSLGFFITKSTIILFKERRGYASHYDPEVIETLTTDLFAELYIKTCYPEFGTWWRRRKHDFI